MGFLSDELIRGSEDIVQKWYEEWNRSPHPHKDVSEISLKHSLVAQLQLIGEQLTNLPTAEEPEQMWKFVERLDPELRIGQRIPIEELVQEYCILLDVVRNWIHERQIDVPFIEYSYFYRALFELTAESVRRYSAEEAKIVSAERAEYLASLAHQMRGPLSAFGVLIEQVKRSEACTYQINQNLVRISTRNLKRLVALIDEVLKLERFNLEEISVHPQLVCPADIVGDVVADNFLDASAKGVRLENLADASLKMEIDPALFLDAIGNLVQNAVKYTSSGFVRVETEEQPDGAIFKVVDSGDGIPSGQQETLFQAIQPGRGGGVGIGLLIVQRAVIAQGGALGFESVSGQGSVFWFRLPRIVTARN